MVQEIHQILKLVVEGGLHMLNPQCQPVIRQEVFEHHCLGSTPPRQRGPGSYRVFPPENGMRITSDIEQNPRKCEVELAAALEDGMPR